MSWFKLGCVLAGLAVVLGAFAAHGLDKFCVEKYGTEKTVVAGQEIALSAKRLNDFRTGAEYQMYHALGLIALGLTPVGCARSRAAAGILFLVGIACFSGSLYALTLTGQKAFGAVAPIGGTAFILGWIAMAFAAKCGKSTVELGTSSMLSRE